MALFLSVPLSFVLLARQRNAMAGNLHERIMSRQEKTDALDAQLAGEDEDPKL